MTKTGASTGRPRVVVDPHGRRLSEIFSPGDLARLHDIAEVVWGQDEPMPVDAARDAMSDAVAIVTAGWRYGPIPASASKLRAIIDVSGGLPASLDYADCFARGIHALTAAPGFARQVAEMALGMALASCRSIVAGDRAMRAGQEKWMHAGNEDTFMLFDQPVGFIGFGGIARALQPLLAPFHCPISAFDPWLGDGYLRSQGVTPVSLEHLVESSRVVFVLAAPTPSNQALLDRAVLERFQPGAVLVLVSRAHVVDFDAMTELVGQGRLRAVPGVWNTLNRVPVLT